MLARNHIECLKGSMLFGSLPDHVFDRVVAHPAVRAVAYKQDDIVCQQGDPADFVFCVAKGAVKLTTSVRNGQDIVVDVFHPGTCFAEALLFRADDYPVSAIALSPCTVISISKAAVEQELRREPDTIAVLLSSTYAHLHRLLRQIERLKATSGLQRVAGYILALDEREADSNMVRIPYEKQTLASLLGIQPETLSRSFKRLEKHGIRVKGPVVIIEDRRALEAFLGET